MTAKDYIDIIFQGISDEYNAIDNLLRKNADAGINMGIAAPFTQTKVPATPEETIPGLPGTLLDSTTSMINMFTSIQSVYHNFGHSISSSEILKLNAIKVERETPKSHINIKLADSDQEDKKIIEGVNYQKKAVDETATKLNEFVQKAENSSKRNSLLSEKSKLPSLWAAYYTRLGKYNAERQALKRSTSKLQETVLENLDVLITSEKESASKLFSDVLHPLCDHIGEISPRIESVRAEFSKSLDWLKFNVDFKNFAKTHRITNQDLPLPVFKPFQFSSKNVKPEQFYIAPDILTYFPLLAAKTLGDFTPENSNELKLVAGQRIYLMETPNQNWVLAMNPFYRQIGFIPISYIQVVGTGLAYVRKQNAIDKDPSLTLSNMPLVAIIQEEPEGTFLVEDEDGNQFSVNNSENALIFL